MGNEVCAFYRVFSEFFVRFSSNLDDDIDEIRHFLHVDESKGHTVLDVNYISHLTFVPDKLINFIIHFSFINYFEQIID